MSKNLGELSGRKGLKENLFEEMGLKAKVDGSPSEKEIEKLAEQFLVGNSSVYGAVTFYDFLKPENKGKKVYVCSGSACMNAGTQEDLKQKLKKKFDDAEIGHMCCLGRCHENSAFNYQGNNYSRDDIDRIDDIVKNGFVRKDEYIVGYQGPQVLTQAIGECSEYYKTFTSALKAGKEKTLNEIKNSGLRGRGGAGFPMGFKLESCMNTPGEVKFIVCNADEGDPGAYSDRYLLEERPHAVLQGMLIAGFIIGAEHGVLYIRAEYPESIAIVQSAIEDLKKNGLIGKDIKGSGFNFSFKIIQAQGAYICGEETALLSSIEGQRPEVRVRPPYPTQQGLFNKPTVVNNVETLAALPYILNHGGDAYAKLGRGKSTGTKLVSLDSFFNKPGIYEVEMGTSLKVVFEELGGGLKSEIKGFHIGGPLGGIVPASAVKDLSVDFESFAEQGFLLGHASVVCIPRDQPMINYLEHLMEFAADESCGKCFPCRLGTKRGHELLAKAKKEDYKIERTLFNDLLETLEKGSLCAHGGGIPLPVKNAMTYFKEELDGYFK